MNLTQLKCLAVLFIFLFIGFGPISPTCLIGMYIVLMRPLWFLNLVENLYNNPRPVQANHLSGTAMASIEARVKCFLSLLAIFIIDIAPIPVTSPIAIAVVLVRPKWFYRLVMSVYGKY